MRDPAYSLSNQLNMMGSKLSLLFKSLSPKVDVIFSSPFPRSIGSALTKRMFCKWVQVQKWRRKAVQRCFCHLVASRTSSDLKRTFYSETRRLCGTWCLCRHNSTSCAVVNPVFSKKILRPYYSKKKINCISEGSGLIVSSFALEIMEIEKISSKLQGLFYKEWHQSMCGEINQQLFSLAIAIQRRFLCEIKIIASAFNVKSCRLESIEKSINYGPSMMSNSLIRSFGKAKEMRDLIFRTYNLKTFDSIHERQKLNHSSILLQSILLAAENLFTEWIAIMVFQPTDSVNSASVLKTAKKKDLTLPIIGLIAHDRTTTMIRKELCKIVMINPRFSSVETPRDTQVTIFSLTDESNTSLYIIVNVEQARLFVRSFATGLFFPLAKRLNKQLYSTTRQKQMFQFFTNKQHILS